MNFSQFLISFKEYIVLFFNLLMNGIIPSKLNLVCLDIYFMFSSIIYFLFFSTQLATQPKTLIFLVFRAFNVSML